MCKHTHTHMHGHDWNTHELTGGRGWLALSRSPAPCWFWALFKVFSALSFPSLTCRRAKCSDPTETFFMLTRNQPVNLSFNELAWPSNFKTRDIGVKERRFKKLLSPLAQSVSKMASKMKSTIFRMPILSKDNFMFPKSARHMVTQGINTNPWRIMGL